MHIFFIQTLLSIFCLFKKVCLISIWVNASVFKLFYILLRGISYVHLFMKKVVAVFVAVRKDRIGNWLIYITKHNNSLHYGKCTCLIRGMYKNRKKNLWILWKLSSMMHQFQMFTPDGLVRRNPNRPTLHTAHKKTQYYCLKDKFNKKARFTLNFGYSFIKIVTIPT